GVVLATVLDDLPTLEVIEEMERAVDAVSKHSDGKGDAELRETELGRARAIVRLCRAQRTKDPEAGLSLAIESYRQNSLLEEPVRAYFLKAGQDLLELHAPKSNYTHAIRRFAKALKASELRNWEELARKFRQHTFGRALDDLSQALAAKDLPRGKRVLAEAGRIAAGATETEIVKEKQYNFYVQYAHGLFPSDLDRYVEVCRELSLIFPEDRGAKEMLDRGHLRRLKNKIGKLETSYKRFDSDQILAAIKEASSQMLTESGSIAVEKYLSQVQAAWSLSLGQEEDPAQIFPLVRSIARFMDWSDKDIKQRGAKAISRILISAAHRADWLRFEVAARVFFEECPNERRPSQLDEAYLRLLAFLEKTGDLEKLAMHLGNYVRFTPSGKVRVQSYLDKYDPKEHESFAQFHRDFAHSSQKPTLPSAEQLSRTAVRRVPGPRSSERVLTTKAKKPPAEVDSSDEESIGAQVLIAGGVLGSVLLIAFVLVMTGRNGLSKFYYYAIAAFWMGTTLGAIVGFGF
ncbi:MAG: hypothetical protein AAF517_24005, partial [Planctomycetota bacterium]